jgi:hypothetical protein
MLSYNIREWTRTDEGVGNVYVELGSDFNEAIVVFSAFDIDMMYV